MQDVDLKLNYFGKFCVQIQTIFYKFFILSTFQKKEKRKENISFLLFSISVNAGHVEQSFNLIFIEIKVKFNSSANIVNFVLCNIYFYVHLNCDI